MTAIAAADKINALGLITVSAYADDETLVITAHTNDSARLDIGSATLKGFAIDFWPTVVDSLK